MTTPKRETPEAKNGGKRMEQLLWRWGGGIGLALLVFISGMSWDNYTRTTDNGHRITSIERSRFTGEQGMKMKAEIMDRIASLYPPSWLREDVTEIKQTLKDIENRIRKLEGRK